MYDLQVLYYAYTTCRLYSFRRRNRKPNSMEKQQELSVYYNDVTDRVEGGVVDPAYQSPHEGAYTELQTHEYAKLQVNKQEEVEKDKNKQYENTKVQYEDNTAENVNKQYENNNQYKNVA